ncbi:quinone oxidoreductase [Candidatus Puniceispirillum sp.]|nr:quinone oxidoreductase [Candidatus Puniceispirillum sp.]MDC3234739.1 quinone oxidoreductase [Candidatus Puniceispirillum sp.]
MRYAIVATKPGGIEVFNKVALGDLVVGASEVLIRHEAIGINFLDVYIRKGAYPWPVDKDLILGSEGAGIIEAVGTDVRGLAVGDRVGYTLANGAYATHRVIDAGYVVKLPNSVSSDLAASIMLKGLTVAYLIHDSYKVKSGDKVLFHAAAGGVGLIAGQWLKAIGATVIGTAGGAEKCALALANGYDHVIDYNSTNFEAEVMRLTDEVGVDVAYDSVGNDTMARSITSTKRHGTIIAFGQSSGPYVDFKITDLAKGSYYLSRPTLFHFAADRAWLETASAKLFDVVSCGTVSISINQRFPLEDVAKAHEALTGRSTTGCTILTP